MGYRLLKTAEQCPKAEMVVLEVVGGDCGCVYRLPKTRQLLIMPRMGVLFVSAQRRGRASLCPRSRKLNSVRRSTGLVIVDAFINFRDAGG